LPRVLAAGGAWTCDIEAATATGVVTIRAVGPGPVTKLLTWDPATGAVAVDGKAVLTQAVLDNALVVGPVILI
jgi:hypothetical protein